MKERYIYDNKIEQFDKDNQPAPHKETGTSPSEIRLKKLSNLGIISIINSNYEVLSFLEKCYWHLSGK